MVLERTAREGNSPVDENYYMSLVSKL